MISTHKVSCALFLLELWYGCGRGACIASKTKGLIAHDRLLGSRKQKLWCKP